MVETSKTITSAKFQRPVTDNNKASILFLIGILISTSLVWMTKTVGQDYGAFQILRARAAVTALCLAPFLLIRFVKAGGFAQRTITSDNPVSIWKMGSRSMFAFSGQAFGISAIIALPLAQSQAISFTKGFIVIRLAVVVLREVVGARRWVAMALGFLGVLVAVQPDTNFDPAAGYAVASAVCFAIATIVLKQLTQEVDNLTLLGIGALAQTAMALPFALYWWVEPSLEDIGIMICLGLVGIVLQNIMLAAYRIGDINVLSPLDYLRLLTGTILGFFAFGEVPTLAILIGAGLIIIANLIAVSRATNSPQTVT